MLENTRRQEAKLRNRSEAQLQSEVQQGLTSEARGPWVGRNLPEGARVLMIDGRGRGVEVVGLERILEIPPELNAPALSEEDVLLHRKLSPAQRRPRHDVAPRIAGREGGRVAEVVDEDHRVAVLLSEAVRSKVVPVIPQLWPAQDVGAPVTRKRRIVVRRAAGEREGKRVPSLI